MNKEDMFIEEDIYEWYEPKEDRLNEERKGCPVLLIGRSPLESKVHVVATVPANLSGIINAAEWVKHVAEILGGRGGGTAIFAQGGGDKVDLIGKAVELGSRFIEEKLQEEKLRNEKNEEERKCILLDPKVTIMPQDPGEPPAWAFPLPGGRIFWADRDVFDALSKRRYDKPCDICPEEVKERCDKLAEDIVMEKRI